MTKLTGTEEFFIRSAKEREQLTGRYLKEPWGKFLNEIGKDPYNASIGERIVAEKAAEKIQELKDVLREIKKVNEDKLYFIANETIEDLANKGLKL